MAFFFLTEIVYFGSFWEIGQFESGEKKNFNESNGMFNVNKKFSVFKIKQNISLTVIYINSYKFKID